MNSKKLLKLTSSLITAILFLLLLFMIFVVISSKASGGEPSFLGYQLKTVLSGSMEPTFKTGSVIAVKPQTDNTKFNKGDVITYRLDEQNLVTHRIIEVVTNEGQISYKTQGDNNKHPDGSLVSPENIVGKYVGYTIPLIGYLIDLAKSKAGSVALLIVPGVLLLIYSAVSILKGLKEIEKATKPKQDGIEKSI